MRRRCARRGAANIRSRGGRTIHNRYTGSFSSIFDGEKYKTEYPINVISEFEKTELRGVKVPDTVLSYYGQKYIPNDVLWVLDSTHDMYCGIFNQSGDQFFSASQDGIVRIFDYTGRYLRLKREIICNDYGWSIVSLVQSHDQRYLAFCSLCAKLNVCNLDDESSQLKVFHLANDIGANDVFSLSFCGSNSSKLICGRNRGRVTICDVETGTFEELNACPTVGADINAVATIEHSGNTFIAGGDDTCIRLFDARALNEGCLACFPGHIDGITYLDCKDDGRYFLSNSKDQTVRLWDLRKHSKAGSERRMKPREAWDYRINAVPHSYHNHKSNDRQSRSVLTLSGHTVRYTLIRAKFSPLHSTGQQFAYSGSAWGDWHIWDLCSGKLVSRNFVKTVTLRDVHWHPWDARVITSGLNGSLTCWGYRRNHAKRKPLLFTHKSSTNITPPNVTERNESAEGVGGDEGEYDSVDEQERYYRSDPGKLENRMKLNRAGFSYRFPRRRPVPSLAYTEIVSDISTSSNSSSNGDPYFDTDDDSDIDHEVLNSDGLVNISLDDTMTDEFSSEDNIPYSLYNWSDSENESDGIFFGNWHDVGQFGSEIVTDHPETSTAPITRSQSRRLAATIPDRAVTGTASQVNSNRSRRRPR